MEDIKKENMQEKDNSEVCPCPWHNAMHGKMSCCFRRRHILRILLGLVILGIVFCGGIKIGELKSSIHRHDSFGMMGNYRMYNRGLNSTGSIGANYNIVSPRVGTSTQP